MDEPKIMSNEIILVVEDVDVLRDGLCEILSNEGFQAISAEDGLAALELMETRTPDLILSDISMPRLGGYELFNLVRARPEWVKIPFIFLTALSDAISLLAGRNLGAEDYLTKPISPSELVTAVRSRLKRSQQIQMAQLQQAYELSLIAMANAIDRREAGSNGHIENVTNFALILARQLGWPDKRLEHLRLGAILHDIGKIQLRENTLLKPPPLEAHEWQEIRLHPGHSADMLKDVPYLAEIAPIVRHHHERWDGTGYPDGLKGEEIPEGARIIAVADSLDAMTRTRSYRQPRSLQEAFQEIKNLAGAQYDPAVVAALERAWQSGQIKTDT